MASKTEIANRALSKVGESRVSNIETAGTKPALAIQDMWDNVRDAMLRNNPWNFAIKLKQLAADGTPPVWGYANRYTLPSDYLALLRIKNDPDYRIRAGYIHTEEAGPIFIEYVFREKSVGNWDPMFGEAMAAQLAVELAEILTQSNTKKQVLLADRDRVVKAAYAADAIANPPQRLKTDEWILAREASILDTIDFSTSS